MNSDHMTPGNPKLAGDPVSACHRRGWLFKPLLVATVVTTGVLGLAACGSSPSSPGVASAGSTTTTLSAGSSGGSRAGSQTGDSRLLKYSQCMRAHGITDFPDPSSNGSLTIGIKPWQRSQSARSTEPRSPKCVQGVQSGRESNSG